MDRIPEKKTEEYSNYLDEVINELMSIKQSLKRGSSRKENRKEVSNLQSAITALRHLRNKNNRHVNQNILLNNREKNLNENQDFSCEDIRYFLSGRVKDDY